MIATVWGARGSIPVSGPRCIRYGGQTTCLEVTAGDGTILILDLGTGVRELGSSLVSSPSISRTINVLLTHVHWDHIQGFPFFKPLYSKHHDIVFHTLDDCPQQVEKLVHQAMSPPFFPVDLSQVSCRLSFRQATSKPFAVGSLTVEQMPLNHPNGGFGYKISDGGATIAFFPDNELTHDHAGGRGWDDYVQFCRHVDVLFHDAQYLRSEYRKRTRGWGHSVFEDTVRLALDAEVKHLVLWHHEPERVDDDVDRIVEEARRMIGESGSSMTCDAAWTGMVVEP